jgi:hypothetical protein
MIVGTGACRLLENLARIMYRCVSLGYGSRYAVRMLALGVTRPTSHGYFTRAETRGLVFVPSICHGVGPRPKFENLERGPRWQLLVDPGGCVCLSVPESRVCRGKGSHAMLKQPH